jgi:hypothetical protein
MTQESAVATLPGRIAARPHPHASGACGHCGHPFALHSNGQTECLAFACHRGADGGPCQQYRAAA